VDEESTTIVLAAAAAGGVAGVPPSGRALDGKLEPGGKETITGLTAGV